MKLNFRWHRLGSSLLCLRTRVQLTIGKQPTVLTHLQDILDFSDPFSLALVIGDNYYGLVYIELLLYSLEVGFNMGMMGR